jgi:hypothetical protein
MKKNNKIYYLIGYLDGYPIISIPTYKKQFNRNKLIKNYSLEKNVKFKIQTKDVFLGW